MFGPLLEVLRDAMVGGGLGGGVEDAVKRPGNVGAFGGGVGGRHGGWGVGGGECFDQGAEGLLYSERVSKKTMGGCCTKAGGVFYEVVGNGPERRCRESS